jgi:probable rRNA maturation factor
MIEINNLTTNQVDEQSLKEVAKKVLIGENKEEIELSIVLVGQGRIRDLNKKYRKKNKVTDVLSFIYDNSGEIVICLSEIKKNIKKFKLFSRSLQDENLENKVFQEELARVLIHGILHVLGYDHELSEEEAKKMEDKQNHYLLNIN